MRIDLVRRKLLLIGKNFFQDDLRGDIIGSIYKKMFGFNVKGAHASNSLFQSANAYFSIMQTYSIAYYIIARLKEMNQPKEVPFIDDY
jgi:hypothetical protein